jgi:hypothetical protein
MKRMKALSIASILSAGMALTVECAYASGATDPAHKYAWGENVGWANAAPTSGGQPVTVHYTGDAGWLSGLAWGENIGWIKMGSEAGGPFANTTAANWGVNLDASGALSGLAWGENVGWINFGHAHCDAAIDMATGMFAGHAWGENIGWLKFSGASPDYGVRTLVFDAQSNGTPNWWLANHGVAEDFDSGDGVPAWRKFVMDTDPNIPGDVLHVGEVICNGPVVEVVFTPASTRRYYTLSRTDHLGEGEWVPVAGQSGVEGLGGEQTLQDTNAAVKAFYSVEVSLSP